MKNKFLSSIIAAITMASLLCIGVSAADEQITVKVDGTAIDFPDQKPVIVNGRTLVPVRFVAEALGYDVKWNEADNSAVIGGKIVLYIGTNRAKIDGRDITLDVESKLINDRTMIPLRFVSENLNCTVDWFGENRMIIVNKKTSNGQEISMWERFKQSELFYECTTYESEHYGHMVLKSNYTSLTDSQIAANTKWYIKRDNDKLNQYADSYDCDLYAHEYSEEVREQLKDILKILYPNEYNSAYEIMMQTLRGALWETFRENVPLMMSGTWGTRYLDNRTVHMVAGYGLTYFGMQINKVGYINPEKPLTLSEKDISDLTVEARKFYPLAKYGLD